MILDNMFLDQKYLHSRHQTWDVSPTLESYLKTKSCIWADVRNGIELGETLERRERFFCKGMGMKSWIIKKKMNWSNHLPIILISFTVSPLHTNLQVANFQRCEHTFHQCQVWGKLQLGLSSAAEGPLALPSPTSSTSFSQ